MPKRSLASAAPRLKLVIRRLPPNLPEELFWKAVAPWVTETTCTWKRFVKGRPAINPTDHPMHSRAYCTMASTESLVEFHRGFDGHVFRSKAGVEHQAVVEFAPVQKIPVKAKVKADARQGTIDDDADFKSYIQSLNAPAEVMKTAEVAPLPIKVESTPLLDHLRLHGSKSSKRKNRSDTSTTDLARSATAAINAAASKRTSKDSGPTLQAGKGRETIVVAAAEPSKGKGKAKAKESKKDETGQVPVPKVKSDVNKGKGKRDNPGKGAETAPANGNAHRAQTPTGPGRTTPTPGTDTVGGPKSPGRGEKSVRGQGGGRGGRGGKTLVERARTQLTDVLAKNAETAARGGGRGRGRGRGKGGQGENADKAAPAPVQPQILARTSAPDPRRARIDG